MPDSQAEEPVQPVLAAWLPDSQKQSSLAILWQGLPAMLDSQADKPVQLSCCLARYARLLTMMESQSCLACIRKSKAG